jgi:hypothetical protein
MSDVWNVQLFVCGRHRLLGRPRRLRAHEVTLELRAHEVTLELTRSFLSNTYDFLCEYHPALTLDPWLFTRFITALCVL